MSSNRLQITSVEAKSGNISNIPNKLARRQEIQATMERMWLQDPEQFNPNRDCVQRKRISRMSEAVKKRIPLSDKLIADVGCGSGEFTRVMRDAGAKLHAVDVAGNALEKLKLHDMRDIKAIQDCLPTTRLDDNTYNVVVCTEVIAYLKPLEYRLAFAELSRIVKTEGYVVCSTPLDTNSDNALERFAALAETEFEIDEWILNYDKLWQQLCHFLEAPGFFAKASRDPEMRRAELQKKRSVGKWWLKTNSSRILGVFWGALSFLASPIARLVRQNAQLMIVLERISRFFWSNSGITHALFIGKRRPLTYPLPADERPKEMKHKRQVWE